MSTYDLNFQYVPGKKNPVADFLSRNPLYGSVAEVVDDGLTASIVAYNTLHDSSEGDVDPLVESHSDVSAEQIHGTVLAIAKETRKANDVHGLCAAMMLNECIEDDEYAVKCNIGSWGFVGVRVSPDRVPYTFLPGIRVRGFFGFPCIFHFLLVF